MIKQKIKIATYILSTVYCFCNIHSTKTNATPKVVSFLSTLINDQFPAILRLPDTSFKIDTIFSNKEPSNPHRLNIRTGSNMFIRNKNNYNDYGCMVLGSRSRTVVVPSNKELYITGATKNNLKKDTTLINLQNQFIYKTTKETPSGDIVNKTALLDFGNNSNPPQITVTRVSNSSLEKTTTKYDPRKNNGIISIEKSLTTPNHSREKFFEDADKRLQHIQFSDGREYSIEHNKISNSETKKYLDPSGRLTTEHKLTDGSFISTIHNSNGIIENKIEINNHTKTQKIYNPNGNLVSENSITTFPNGESIETIVNSASSQTISRNADGSISSILTRLSNGQISEQVFSNTTSINQNN